METTISNLAVKNHWLEDEKERILADKNMSDMALIRLQQEAREEKARMTGEVSVLLKNKNKYRDQNKALRKLIQQNDLGAELPDPVEESYPGTKPLSG